MRSVRTGLKLRMSLCGHVEIIGRKLDHLNDPSVRRHSAELHAVLNKHVSVVIVDLISVAMTLGDIL